MLPVDAAILRTVLYADVFNFALTPNEVHRYLIHDRAIDRAHVTDAIEHSTSLSSILHKQDGYICLKHRQDIIVLRMQREAISLRLWDSAIQYGQLLSHIPFVEMVALTGSLAVHNPSCEHDDFDYLLITRPKRVWLARFFAVVMVRIIRLFGRELCPNYVLASDQLQQSRQDLYTAHEVAQMHPIYGQNLYQQMIEHNDWILSLLPNATPYPTRADTPRRLRKLIEGVFTGRLGDMLEQWEYRRKLKKFTPRVSEVQSSAEINANSVKGHFEDHGIRVLERYDLLLREYGLINQYDAAVAGD